jgi:hypothetical protein
MKVLNFPFVQFVILTNQPERISGSLQKVRNSQSITTEWRPCPASIRFWVQSLVLEKKKSGETLNLLNSKALIVSNRASSVAEMLAGRA